MPAEAPTLVVLGTRTDPHVERVAARLLALGGVDVFVLDYLEDTRFSLETDELGRRRLCVAGRELPPLYLVWDRTKILAGTVLYVRGDEISSGYAAQEWRALSTLLGGLNPDRTVNSLASRRCLIKPYQQTVAAQAGFLVPPTLVSNDKPCVTEFQDRQGGRTIMKSLSAGKVKPAGEGEFIPYNVMTMRVTPEDLEAADEAQIAMCPHFFQREIEKSHELRVVVVGDRILPFRVDSQDVPSAAVDWRKGVERVPFSPCQLDEDLLDKIRGFMSRMELFSGSLDLIVDREGRTWFLECNQDGAWGWLDDLSGGAVTEAFAQGFLERLRQIG